jgi:hypothetical protein
VWGPTTCVFHAGSFYCQFTLACAWVHDRCARVTLLHVCSAAETAERDRLGHLAFEENRATIERLRRAVSGLEGGPDPAAASAVNVQLIERAEELEV